MINVYADACGVRLPIVTATDRPDRHIFIGPGESLRSSPVGFGVNNLGGEDLRIVIRDNHIAIAGGRPRGTLYGVYTFLEDYLGVRFLTHDHTHVPAIGQQQLIGPLDRIYRPPFVNYRDTAYGALHQYPVFSVRSRNNAIDHVDPKFGGASPFRNHNHSWYRQVSIDKYGKDHPRYYALINGQRQVEWMSQLCLTNPDVLKIVIQAVRDEIENNSHMNLSVGQNDGDSDYCRCEGCAAIDAREGSHMGALLTFVNKVADEVAKTHPDVFVGTLAYNYSRQPTGTIKPRDNVQITFCSSGACQLHAFTDASCPKNVAFMQDLHGWSRICKQLYAWTYNIYFRSPPVPYPNLYALKPNINVLLDAGVKGVFMQCADHLVQEMSELRCYLISRLLWNPKLNDREVIDEFLDLHYGQAAAPIRHFIKMTHNHYRDAGTHNNPLARHGWELPVDEGIAKAGLRLFSKAMKLAENDEVRARVEKAAICAYAAAIDPIWRIKEDAAIDLTLADQMRPHVKKFFRLCDKYELGERHARKRIEAILANQQSIKPAINLPLIPISKQWKFTIDPENKGERDQYFKADFDDSNWTVLEDYDFWTGDYLGMGWYRQTITPPADIADKKHLYLLFGAVDEEAFVYINGKYACERSVKSTGQSPGVIWDQPFLHDAKGLIRPGQPNVIVVKVHNTSQAGGIWKPVYLFPTDEEWTAQAIADSR